MSGVEILVFVMGCCASGAGALAATLFMGERRKRRFVDVVAAVLAAHVDDIESGDIVRPLAFRVGGVRVLAAVRGQVEVWQLERIDEAAGPSSLAVVYAGWRSPDARGLALVGPVTPRLFLYSDDETGARHLLARAGADLAFALGRRARRFVVGRGRAFLEVTRRGLSVAELQDALARFEALNALMAGRRAVLPMDATTTSESAVAGPSGMPVPALTG